jgi:hypothetical protein
MTPRNLLARISLTLPIAAVAFIGAGSAQAQNSPCNNGICKVDVTVSDCSAGTYSVSHDPIPVPAPNNIEWTLITNGYKFGKDSIVINGQGFTDRPGVNGNGKKYTVHDDHSVKGTFKYSIKVYTDSGSACKLWDPRIVNE